MNTVFPGFELKRIIRDDPSGKVWMGVRTSDGRQVTIKHSHPQIGSSQPLANARSWLEAHSASLIGNCPAGIPEVFGVIQARQPSDIFGLISAYVEGSTLREILQTVSLNPTGRLESLLIVFEETMRILSVLHQRGLVHGYLSADRILLGDGPNRGQIYVLDFCWARAGLSENTIQNIPPELTIDPSTNHHASDQWSIARLFLQTLQPHPHLYEAFSDHMKQAIERAQFQSPETRFSHIGQLAQIFAAERVELAELNPSSTMMSDSVTLLDSFRIPQATSQPQHKEASSPFDLDYSDTSDLAETPASQQETVMLDRPPRRHRPPRQTSPIPPRYESPGSGPQLGSFTRPPRYPHSGQDGPQLGSFAAPPRAPQGPVSGPQLGSFVAPPGYIQDPQLGSFVPPSGSPQRTLPIPPANEPPPQDAPQHTIAMPNSSPLQEPLFSPRRRRQHEPNLTPAGHHQAQRGRDHLAHELQRPAMARQKSLSEPSPHAPRRRASPARPSPRRRAQRQPTTGWHIWALSFLLLIFGGIMWSISNGTFENLRQSLPEPVRGFIPKDLKSVTTQVRQAIPLEMETYIPRKVLSFLESPNFQAPTPVIQDNLSNEEAPQKVADQPDSAATSEQATPRDSALAGNFGSEVPVSSDNPSQELPASVDEGNQPSESDDLDTPRRPSHRVKRPSRRRARRSKDELDCKAGFAPSCRNIAEHALERGNKRKARLYFEHACDANDGKSCADIAEMWMNGAGGPARFSTAKSFLVRACRLGHSASCESRR